MKEIDIAMTVVRQEDFFILQQRPDIVEIGAAGLIGFFGGKIKKSKKELAEEAASRELSEETSLLIPPGELEYVGKVRVSTTHHDDPNTIINAQVYAAEVHADMDIDVMDGYLVRYTDEQARSNLESLTPATKAAFKELIWKED